jgi:hypothetical protein
MLGEGRKGRKDDKKGITEELEMVCGWVTDMMGH